MQFLPKYFYQCVLIIRKQKFLNGCESAGFFSIYPFSLPYFIRKIVYCLMQKTLIAMWTLGLLKTMKDPKYVVYSDHKIVMIKDVYPKAKHHYLVISKEDIAGIRDVKSKHLSLLEYMDQKAKEYISQNAPGIDFKYGYHSKPSMHRLHLHVISTDMLSPSLKTKKHWNSFTTKFFLDSKEVIKELKSEGKIKLPDLAECERLLNQDLKCHKCSIALANMPKLKAHILTHSVVDSPKTD